MDFRALNAATELTPQILQELRDAYQANASTARSFAAHCTDFIRRHCEPGLTAREQLYVLLHPECNRNCRVCSIKLTKFWGPTRGWGDYCGIACSTCSTIRKQKLEETSIERYGVKDPSQSTTVKNKRKATNLKKYGHECNLHAPALSAQIRKKISSKHIETFEKVKQTNLERYGVQWQTQRESLIDAARLASRTAAAARDRELLQTPPDGFCLLEEDAGLNHLWRHDCGHEFRSPAKNIKCVNCRQHSSQVELNFFDFLQTLVDRSKIIRHAKLIDGSTCQVDFYLPELQLAIEINGAYWHQYEKDNGRMLWKTNELGARGIQLVHIWDLEWLDQNKQELVKNFLRSKLSTNKKIFARNTQIQEVSHKTATSFLNQYHRQGAAAASKRFGLYQNNELLCLLTLAKPRFNKHIEWEIIRFCSLPGQTVVGGFSKLLAHFESVAAPTSICTYADRAWGDGAAYAKNGFEFKKTTKPGYFWCNSTYDIVSRYDSQHRNLPLILGSAYDPSLTEYENMTQARYFMCQNVGNNYFEKFLPN